MTQLQKILPKPKLRRKPLPRYWRENSRKWRKGDRKADQFFVYILKLADGTFYAGQSRELRIRLTEHNDGLTKSTRGKKPVLVWSTIVKTRAQATSFEVALKKKIDKNPRAIRRMVMEFQDLIREVEAL